MSRAKKPETGQATDKPDFFDGDLVWKNTSVLTPSQLVRLECVQLAYRHDRSPNDIAVRADELAAFVMDGRPAPVQSGNGGQAGPETSPT